MANNPDLVIRGGSIADGLGGELFDADDVARSFAVGPATKSAVVQELSLTLTGVPFLGQRAKLASK